MTYHLHQADCLGWLTEQPPCSFHAVLTDPPFGVEFQQTHMDGLQSGSGGIWRIPPPNRRALPRFSILTPKEIAGIEDFFSTFAERLFPVLVPGAHVLVASNPLVSQSMWQGFIQAGFGKRGEIVRLTQTLRGGDRPKGAEEEFPMISVMPRSAWEPWGLFRKPCESTVAENLRKYGTGGLRRISSEQPFSDVISSVFPTKEERAISSHPTLKPQSWLRPLVRALLPMGGVLLDPFMGSGSTIAAAQAMGIDSHGVEKSPRFFEQAEANIGKFLAIEDDLASMDAFDLAIDLGS